MSARDFARWTEDEVAEWVGASVTFGQRAKHNEAILAFNGETRFVVYPASPSDNHRALYNHVADVRRTLAEMGAVRNERRKAEAKPYRPANDGKEARVIDNGERAEPVRDPWEILQELADRPLCPTSGAYPDIDAADYHGREICPGPSAGSSGLKTLLTKSPRHFWWGSSMNPDRPHTDRPCFVVGRAAHDIVLLGDRFSEAYHVLPEGFSRAKTKVMATEIAEADEAIANGLTCLTQEDLAMVHAMAASLKANKLATAILSNGQPEVTLTWQDKETGVWLRARPDFLPSKRKIVPDLKFMADGSPKAFARSIGGNGYAMSAALYSDGIEAVYGERPDNWLHVVVEKTEPYVVSLYELPAEDIDRGRWLNRKAIRLFADCLSADRWPGYSDEPTLVGLTGWDRRQIDEGVALSGETETQPSQEWMTA